MSSFKDINFSLRSIEGNSGFILFDFITGDFVIDF